MSEYDIDDYSVADIIRLFDLNTDPSSLTLQDCDLAEKKLVASRLKGHLTSETYVFFRKALLKLKQYVSIPVFNSIPKKNAKKISEEFNENFENSTQYKQLLERRQQHTKWFQTETEPNNDYKVVQVKDIHSNMDNIRQKMVMEKNTEETSVLDTGSKYAAFFDDEEEEIQKSSYITTDPFDKLKYDDIRRVYRDQTVIPVKTITEVPVISLEQYQSGRSSVLPMLEKSIATEILQSQEQKRIQEWKQKRERYFQKNA